ncbi:uncharacterized protein LOC135941417 [Cloeon dipterum]|uniref:uncharacterized protein LOC135941417 n=1 Tax=Cloeon dipterum TaxID=197152 RepID=UPI00321F8802
MVLQAGSTKFYTFPKSRGRDVYFPCISVNFQKLKAEEEALAFQIGELNKYLRNGTREVVGSDEKNASKLCAYCKSKMQDKGYLFGMTDLEKFDKVCDRYKNTTLLQFINMGRRVCRPCADLAKNSIALCESHDCKTNGIHPFRQITRK